VAGRRRALSRARGPDPAAARRVIMPGARRRTPTSSRSWTSTASSSTHCWTSPRRGDGYCVDDVARALIVLVREPDQTPELAALAETCLAFLEGCGPASTAACTTAWQRGQLDRRPRTRRLVGSRAVGARRRTAPAHRPRPRARARVSTFHRAASARSPYGRAMAFGTLGAADVLAAHPDDLVAHRAAARWGVVDRDPARRPMGLAGTPPPVRQCGAPRSHCWPPGWR
jgi:hypothetical protein